MLKRLATGTFLYTLLSIPTTLALGNDLSQETDLILRFTGVEAQKLFGLLKDRSALETDRIDRSRFHGNRANLACSLNAECYLWLSRKEWLTEGSYLKFTIPVKQSTFRGQLSISRTPAGLSTVDLQLEDLELPGTFSFTQALNCSTFQGPPKPAPLQPNGDCQLELSRAQKNTIPYSVSKEYVQNLENILLNFKGPWARKLLEAANKSETDPYNSKRIRAQLGPNLYCWNLDPSEEELYLDDRYVCQGSFMKDSGSVLDFISEGVTKEGQAFSLTLQPEFRHGLLRNFELFLQLEGQTTSLSYCPNNSKNSGYAPCGLFYDLKMDAGRYPIAITAQGIAVGWGIVQSNAQ